MAGNSFRLRPARPADRWKIWGMIFAEGLNPLSLDWRRFVLAETEGGVVVGCAQVKPHADGTRELASLAVAQAVRGQGIARRLIEHLQAEWPPPLYLTCRNGLAGFYERFGFRLLQDAELSPYFRRLKRLVSTFVGLTRSKEGLAVMIWEGSR